MTVPDEPYDYDPASDNGTSDDFNADNTPEWERVITPHGRHRKPELPAPADASPANQAWISAYTARHRAD
jgi:hypothetical protein